MVKKYAVLNGNKVSNVVISEDSDFASKNNWIACGDQVSVGWLYNDKTFSKDPLEEKKALDKMKVEIRTKRDALLAQTDWWASSDLTITDAQKAYRQALRDVPSQEGFPDSITWPTKP